MARKARPGGPIGGGGNDDGSNDDLVAAIGGLTKSVDALKSLIGADKEARERQVTRAKSAQTLRSLGVPENLIDDMVSNQQEVIYSSSSFVGRAMGAQFPRGEQALSLLAYSRAARGGIPSRAYGLGELLKMQAVQNRPVGAPLYAPGGGRMAYSSGSSGGLSRSQREALYSPEGLGSLGTEDFLSSLSEEEQRAFSILQRPMDYSVPSSKKEAKAKEAAWSARERARALLKPEALIGKGKNVTGLLESSSPELQGLGRTLSGRGPGMLSNLPLIGSRLGALGESGGLLFGAGEMLQMGARLAGPIGWAVGAGTMVGKGLYSGGMALNAFNREGAALGYGYGGVLGQGAQTSLQRSIETSGVGAFASYGFGLSGQQLSQARSSLEGMGVGGPGQEKRYGSYFSSMADVMKNTGLSANTLAPFYEDMLRTGGAPGEIESLTKLLRDELPQAANSSRMSLEAMAQSITKTVGALSSSPYNAATKPQLTQALIGTAGFGVPAGLQGVASGSSLIADSIAMSQFNLSPFQLSTHPAERQMAAVEFMMNRLPKGATKDAESFFQYQNTKAGAANIAILSAQAQINPDTMKDIINRGPKDVLAGLGLAATFNNSMKGDLTIKRFNEKDVNRVMQRLYEITGGSSDPARIAAAVASLSPRDRQIYKEQSPSFQKGTDSENGLKYGEISRHQNLIEPNGKVVNLYGVSGKSIEQDYSKVINTIKNSLRGDDLKKFNEGLKTHESGLGVGMYDYIQKAAAKLSKDATQTSGDTLTISADNWLKDKFKFAFHSGTKAPGVFTVVSPGSTSKGP